MEIVLGKTAGFCYGVKRAVEGAKKELVQNKNVCCLGELVHNKQVIENLKKDGMKFINNFDESTQNVIIRAHGVEKEIYEIAKKKNVEIKDYTCPNVLKIHEIVEKYAQNGYAIILCGNKEHPENVGTISYARKNLYVIEEDDDAINVISEIKKREIKKVLLISQTTFSLEKFNIILEILKKGLNKDIKFVVKNTICRATELRQKETENISKDVDLMIIIGGKNSSNTKKLYEIAKKNCRNSIIIESVKEIVNEDKEKIEKVKKIGIMAGASTPNESIEEVENFLYNLKK